VTRQAGHRIHSDAIERTPERQTAATWTSLERGNEMKKRIPRGGGQGPRFNVFLPDGCLYRDEDGTSEFPRQQADQAASRVSGTVTRASGAAARVQAALDQHPYLNVLCTCNNREPARQP
jgi:hypothetical protein